MERCWTNETVGVVGRGWLLRLLRVHRGPSGHRCARPGNGASGNTASFGSARSARANDRAFGTTKPPRVIGEILGGKRIGIMR